MNTTTTEVSHRAIHHKVLLVYVASIPEGDIPEGGWRGDWKAYVVPVPGKSHDEEAKALWGAEGSQMQKWEARAMWPRMAEHFDSLGLEWRR